MPPRAGCAPSHSSRHVLSSAGPIVSQARGTAICPSDPDTNERLQLIKYIHLFVTNLLALSIRRVNGGAVGRQGHVLSLRQVPLVKRLVDRFGEQFALCPDTKALGQLLEEASWELGFHFFALLHHASLSSSQSSYVRFDNYPADWVIELEARGFARHDPVHFASRRTSAGFTWCEIDAIARLDQRQRAVLNESRRFGLGGGFTIPANVPGEPSGSCSFAVRHGTELPRSRLMCAELVGVHAFRAARRLNGDFAPSGRPHLSKREIECLRWVASGKTDWEVAAILGISVETARQYVKRARRAYDVVSRTQLVVLGLRDAWLGFEDAIPPDG